MSKKAIVLAVALLLVAAISFAAVKTYQVTGPVLAVTADSITVQKGTEKWEIAREAGTKVKGDPKVGSKVTIEYRMIATDVDVKAEKAAKPAKKK